MLNVYMDPLLIVVFAMQNQQDAIDPSLQTTRKISRVRTD